MCLCTKLSSLGFLYCMYPFFYSLYEDIFSFYCVYGHMFKSKGVEYKHLHNVCQNIGRKEVLSQLNRSDKPI